MESWSPFSEQKISLNAVSASVQRDENNPWSNGHVRVRLEQERLVDAEKIQAAPTYRSLLLRHYRRLKPRVPDAYLQPRYTYRFIGGMRWIVNVKGCDGASQQVDGLGALEDVIEKAAKALLQYLTRALRKLMVCVDADEFGLIPAMECYSSPHFLFVSSRPLSAPANTSVLIAGNAPESVTYALIVAASTEIERRQQLDPPKPPAPANRAYPPQVLIVSRTRSLDSFALLHPNVCMLLRNALELDEKLTEIAQIGAWIPDAG